MRHLLPILLAGCVSQTLDLEEQTCGDCDAAAADRVLRDGFRPDRPAPADATRDAARDPADGDPPVIRDAAMDRPKLADMAQAGDASTTCEPGARRFCDGMGLGACDPGESVCQLDGTWGECIGVIGPSPEACDGLDSDCDGFTDEALRQPCEGTCGAGFEICLEGVWQACSGERPIRAEDCNDVDDDCDGTVDEQLGRSCGPEIVGRCRSGWQICGEGVWGECDGAVSPRDEVCNGEDDDCDGESDEQLERACGQCGQGQQTCVGAAWAACEGDVAPAPEICNGLDDDCDGTPDEDTSTLCPGECSRQLCVGGALEPCEPLMVDEECNGEDDDCDGNTDEGLSRPCGSEIGLCMPGTEICAQGQWAQCRDEVGPSAESCDGEDQDCDGAADEDVSCAARPHAVLDCLEGACAVAGCDRGWFDVDGEAENGCERGCEAGEVRQLNTSSEHQPRVAVRQGDWAVVIVHNGERVRIMRENRSYSLDAARGNIALESVDLAYGLNEWVVAVVEDERLKLFEINDEDPFMQTDLQDFAAGALAINRAEGEAVYVWRDDERLRLVTWSIGNPVARHHALDLAGDGALGRPEVEPYGESFAIATATERGVAVLLLTETNPPRFTRFHRATEPAPSRVAIAPGEVNVGLHWSLRGGTHQGAVLKPDARFPWDRAWSEGAVGLTFNWPAIYETDLGFAALYLQSFPAEGSLVGRTMQPLGGDLSPPLVLDGELGAEALHARGGRIAGLIRDDGRLRAFTRPLNCH